MIKRIVAAFGLMTISAAPAAGAPEALNAGHWSLGFEIERDVNIEVGYGLFDMTRLIVSAGFSALGDEEIPSSRIEY